MSIYASGAEVGRDEEYRPTGEVLYYGGSHDFPEPDDVRGVIELASIPGHCVPGHEDNIEHVGPYLRMSVMENVEDVALDATVILTEAGARTLRDHLDRWLSEPKVHPYA